ncbi:MAG: DUF2227 family putative metal-binding protein [Oligoflexia bacterium]|nr:DUF2227 family putative metal-binding protein [Oligoflexia bacterium]MBF0365951.1 DUF2227 family putative metal-binding protein [Oligoflexia bacterium]
MPNRKTHIKINLILALPLGLALFYYAFKPVPLLLLLVFLLSFLYNTFVFNPDLDLARYVRPLSLKGLLIFPFIPYSWFFRHRGLSHSLLWGTSTRVLYLMLVMFVIYGMWCFLTGAKGDWSYILGMLETKKEIFITVAAAWVYGDIWHITLDRCRY